MAKNKKEAKKDKNEAAALFIPAGLFIGFGIGFLLDNLIPWMFMGLGVGFIAFAISLLCCKKK
jgi:F0F1-type ATP synthase assembly protein I